VASKYHTRAYDQRSDNKVHKQASYPNVMSRSDVRNRQKVAFTARHIDPSYPTPNAGMTVALC
jgi:hypothetical protein